MQADVFSQQLELHGAIVAQDDSIPAVRVAEFPQACKPDRQLQLHENSPSHAIYIFYVQQISCMGILLPMQLISFFPCNLINCMGFPLLRLILFQNFGHLYFLRW